MSCSSGSLQPPPLVAGRWWTTVRLLCGNPGLSLTPLPHFPCPAVPAGDSHLLCPAALNSHRNKTLSLATLSFPAGGWRGVRQQPRRARRLSGHRLAGGGPALGNTPTVRDSSKLSNRKMRILANANHSFPLPNYCAITEYCNALVTAIRNLLDSNIAALAHSSEVVQWGAVVLQGGLQTSCLGPARLARRSPWRAAGPGNVLPGYSSSQPLGFPRSGGRAQRPERRCW